MSGHYHVDCEEVCEECLRDEYAALSKQDKREYGGVEKFLDTCDLDDGEQDSPANCARCHRPMDYRLTTDGVAYVMEKIRESMDEGPASWNAVHECYKGTYYEGSRHVEIVRDWAEELTSYCGLSKKDEKLLNLFLTVTRDGYKIHPQEQEVIDLFLELYDGE